MSKYMLYSDLHLTRQPPSSCTESYLEDMVTLVNQAGRVAHQRDCVVQVWAGDVFHHKAPSRTPHELVNLVIDIVQAEPLDVYIVPGNHDMKYDRPESVEHTQPLGEVLKAGAHLLNGWASPFKMFGVPWLGYPAGDAAADPEQQEQQKEIVFEVLREYREHQQRFPDPNYLVVTHAPLYPPGQELRFEYFPAEWWAEAMGGRGCVFYGHVHEPVHEPDGVFRVGGVTFCNNGALSRGSLHEHNLVRQVGVTIWDDKTGEFEFVSLDAKPADQVFRLREKQQATDVQGRLDDFLAGVSSTSLDVLSVESVFAYVKTLGLGKEAEDLVEELLAEAAVHES